MQNINKENLKEFLEFCLNKGVDIKYYFEDSLKGDKDFNYEDTKKDFLEYINNLYEEEIKAFFK